MMEEGRPGNEKDGTRSVSPRPPSFSSSRKLRIADRDLPFPPLNLDINNNIVTIHSSIKNYEPSEGSNQTFKGIEIFYRVYQTDLAASAALKVLSDFADEYNSDPESFMTIVTNDTYRFLRLQSLDLYGNIKSAPLLPLAATDDNDYFLNLNSGADWTITDSSNTSVFTDGSTIIRNLDTSTSNTSFYLKDFITGDDDFTGSTINPGDTVYIVFFAVSFGVDQTTVGQTVYSVPYIPAAYASY